MLAAHNKYRAMHHAEPLTLDAELTKGAQEWAEHLASVEKLETDDQPKMKNIGQNLAMKYKLAKTNFYGAEFTDYWYSGIANYDFAEHSPKDSASRSFTQMVWRETQMAGFGRSVSRSRKVYAVGHYMYFPFGKIVDAFATNVLPREQISDVTKVLPQEQIPESKSETVQRSRDGSEFTDFWYSGISNYDFAEHHPKGSGARSFSQLVWRGTHMAGFGRAVSRSGKVYAVGRYFPAGNVVDSFATNVLPLGQIPDRRLETVHRSYGIHHDGGPSGTPGSDINRDVRPPLIGPMRPTDTLISTNKSIKYENDRIIVTVEEKYRTPDGATYSRQQQTTHYKDRPDTSEL